MCNQRIFSSSVFLIYPKTFHSRCLCCFVLLLSRWGTCACRKHVRGSSFESSVSCKACGAGSKKKKTLAPDCFSSLLWYLSTCENLLVGTAFYCHLKYCWPDLVHARVSAHTPCRDAASFCLSTTKENSILSVSERRHEVDFRCCVVCCQFVLFVRRGSDYALILYIKYNLCILKGILLWNSVEGHKLQSCCCFFFI